MPKALERKLEASAKKLGLGKERTGAYVYGTMNKIKNQLKAVKSRMKRV